MPKPLLLLLCCCLAWPGVLLAQDNGIDAAPTIGDPFAPTLGNAGIDVQSVRLTLTADPIRATLDGSAALDIRLTQEDLISFSLDLRQQMSVSAVKVNDRPAAWTHEADKLRVQLPEPTPAGTQITVGVDYGGRLRPVDSPYLPGVISGPMLASARFAFVSQPDMASAWMPSNDHPIDAASYEFVLTVPQPYEAVANGELLETRDNPDGTRTFVYAMPDEMASYLATIAVGDYTVVTDRTPEGLPLLHYVYAGTDPDQAARLFEDTPLAMAILSNYFGPYPYDSYGHVLVPLNSAALETQTLSAMPYRLGDFGDPIIWRLIVHELAHQWFGNYVRLETWADIWLNEGFATWAEWLADEDRFGADRAIRHRLRAEGALSNSRRMTPLAEPLPGEMFSLESYQKGGWVLHMLRAALGDEVFFPMLRAYLAAFAEDSVTNAEFFDFIEGYTGQDFETFRQQWLYQPGLPRYRLFWTSDGATAQVRLCSLDAAQRYTFALPIEFEDGGGARQLVTLALAGQAQTDASYTLDFLPRGARIDPYEDVLGIIDARRVNALPACAP